MRTGAGRKKRAYLWSAWKRSISGGNDIKKLAVITNFLKTYGGAEVFLENVLLRLSEDYRIELFTLDASPDMKKRFSPLVENIHSYGFKYGRAFPKGLFWLNPMVHALGMNVKQCKDAMKVLADDVNSRGFDAVFAQQAHITPLAFPYLEPPTVFYCHEPVRHIYDDALKAELRVWKRKKNQLTILSDALLEIENRHFMSAYQAAITEADAILVNSRYTKRSVKGAWGVESKVVYPGVNLEQFTPKGPRGVEGVNGKYILAVGSFMVHKAPIFAVEATAASGLNLPLVMVGGGSDLIDPDIVFEKADKLGVDLRVVDGLTTEELAAAYRGAAMTICPNIMEPFGLVPLESIGCGTPVVAVNEAGFKETIGRFGGGLLSPRDPSMFGKAMHRMFMDRMIWENKMGIVRKKVKEAFSWDTCAVLISKNIEKLIKTGTQPTQNRLNRTSI